jgi:hypothetical protein
VRLFGGDCIPDSSRRGPTQDINGNWDGYLVISKACSDMANAKNLHGKQRKKFRANCKRHGGKM